VTIFIKKSINFLFGLKKNSSRPMRLLESYDLMNEEVEWETEQSLMTNMIQVND